MQILLAILLTVAIVGLVAVLCMQVLMHYEMGALLVALREYRIQHDRWVSQSARKSQG